MGKYGPNYCETNFANLPSKGRWIELHLRFVIRSMHTILRKIGWRSESYCPLHSYRVTQHLVDLHFVDIRVGNCGYPSGQQDGYSVQSLQRQSRKSMLAFSFQYQIKVEKVPNLLLEVQTRTQAFAVH